MHLHRISIYFPAKVYKYGAIPLLSSINHGFNSTYFIFLPLISSLPLGTTNSLTIESLALVTTEPARNVSNVCLQFFQISDEIKTHPTPPWLSSWEELEADSPCGLGPTTSVQEAIPVDVAAKIVTYNLALGQYIEQWDLNVLKRDNLLVDLDTFWETGTLEDDSEYDSEDDLGSTSEDGSLEKRSTWRTLKLLWKKSASHKARVFALATISNLFGNCGTAVLELTRSAVCATTDGKYGCFSWLGGGHTFKCNIAHSVMLDGLSGILDYALVSEHASKAFLDLAGHAHSACLSNRLNGCS